MNEIKELIASSEKIVILTGAGVSTDSDIPDFKSTDETWEHPISRTEAISRYYFNKNPKHFWSIYNTTFGQKTKASPNRFHYYLASLEQNHKVTIVTQNVDGLHAKAGSTDVIEAHGNINEAICSRLSCSTIYPYETAVKEELPRCEKCNKILKPNISLFGEGINGFGIARDEIMESDLLIVAGTSLRVGPINELPLLATYFAPKVNRLWMNTDKPDEQYNFTHSYFGTFSEYLDNLNR